MSLARHSFFQPFLPFSFQNQLVPIGRNRENGCEVPMLSRGKLVQDWRRRLAAAEAEGAESQSLKWLYQMRVRLYRFLLSCYHQEDWRADEPSISAEETVADVPHGDTTTILDCPLDGKPAKTAGKMLAVLKSVSAAQDYPAESGPLLGGIAADDWVVAVSVRDRLKMAGCQELLRQYGIATKWTLLGEIKVRLFDLERATQLVRTHREALRIKPQLVSLPYAFIAGRTTGGTPSWPVRLFFVGIFLAPLYAVFGLLLIQCFVAMLRMPLLEAEAVSCWLVICYFGGMQLGLLTMFVMDHRRRSDERREAKALVEREKEKAITVR
jgi:hypothetical protein